MKTTTDLLGTQKISKLMLNLAIPAIIAQVVNLVYSLVDRIYIGHMENGTVAMSALAVSLPLVTLITAFTQLVGTGGAPLAAMRLGEKNDEIADKILTNSFACLVFNGIFLTTILLVFQEQLLYAFGATADNIEIAKEYVTIYSLGTIFVQIALGLNPYINTQGQAKFGMITTLISATINIILDPIFIFALNMGVKGAAYATIIAQAVAAVWVLKFFFSPRSKLKIKREYIIPDIKIVMSILALGVSPFIMTATESLLQISFNNQLAIYGGTIAVGSLTILQSCYQTVNMSLFGLCQGVQPILSYNFGAKNLDRVRSAFKMLLVVAIVITALGFGTVLLFPSFFVSLFSSDIDTITFASWGIRVFMLGGLTFGVQMACQQSFLALGQAKRSLILALFRKVIVLIPLIYILPSLIGNTGFAINIAQPIADFVYDSGSVFAILFAESISDFLAAVVTGITFFFFYKNHLKEKKDV